MEQNNKSLKLKTKERKILIALSVIFLTALLGAWFYSMNLRKAIVAKNSFVSADARALVEVEQLRNLSDSQFSKGLSFFLLGSSTLFDDLKKDKQSLTTALLNFEKQSASPKVSEIIKRIESVRQQHQEIFDQAMDFRAKQTESKIVGQFYRAKTIALKANINKSLDEIGALFNSEFERTQVQAQEVAHDTESQIPRAMFWLTGVFSFLFAALAILVLRLLAERTRHTAERARLRTAAQDAVSMRDGILSAVSQDLNEPIQAITQAAVAVKNSPDVAHFVDGVAVIESSVVLMNDRIKDILDQTKADMGTMTLRVEQISLDAILDEARLMLEPMAKQKDVRLEFYPVNPPVLAFIDRERVLRVLSNLVGNAIKFSPKQSKVIVKVRSDQQFVYVSVRDSGPGIPEKQLAEIFTHFWQARKTADLGPGIGLTIVKTIIEAHSGIVSVESHSGHGSTFTFSLPRRRPPGAILRKPAPTPIRYNTGSVLASGKNERDLSH